MKTVVIVVMLSFSCFGQGASGFGVRSPMQTTHTTPVLPLSVTNVLGWWNGSNVYTDAGSTKCNDGDAPQQWSDLSGFNNHAVQTVPNLQGYYRANSLNGYGAVQYRGSHFTYYERLFGETNAPEHYCFVVAYITNSTVNQAFIDTHEVYEGTGIDVLTGNMRIYNQGGVVSSIFPIPSLSWQVFSFKANTEYPKNRGNMIFVNGKSFWTTLVARKGPSGVIIGNSQGLNNCCGMVAEAIFCQGLMPEQQRVGLELYLKQKYALPNPF